MVAGAVLGYQVGSDLRDRLNQRDEQRTLREWQLCAQQLTEELRQTNAKLVTATDMVANRDDAFQEMKELARDYAEQATEAIYKVEEKDREIKTLKEKQGELLVEQERLKAGQEELNILNSAQAKHLKFLETQVKSLENSSTHNSAQAAAYAGLFELLANEISRSTNIEDFSDLNPVAIQKAYKDAYLGFRRAGKIVYEPDQVVGEVAERIIRRAP